MTQPHTPPADRFCDLVMKGGIASGVVYPKAIEELSHHYHFQSIGGTSAGAIAAAVTAAAEYRRRETGSREGFELLGTLPTELGKTVPSGESKLLSLFQPQPALRRLFSVLLAALNRGTTLSRILHVIIGFIKAYWPATLIAAAIACPIGVIGLGWFAAFLTLIILVPLLVGIWVYADITRRLVDHSFGLCTGMPVGTKNEALSPWLHRIIQDAAGLDLKQPLTFEHLWKAKAFPDWLKKLDPSAHSIDLKMFSTNLSHGRPYIFPLSDNECLYFKIDEMEKYLPKEVVDCLVKHSPSSQPGGGTNEEDELYKLPAPEKCPILLAARMSLSFPFLFTAIPLYVVERDSQSKNISQPCWFSDGGISSNFPIHLFDDLLPTWPTFGLTLEPKGDGHEEFELSTTYDSGYEEHWNHEPKDKKGAKALGWFISAIVGTMQNWNDNSLARMPGVRDRVARVKLEKHEGGLNLNMQHADIIAVANRGAAACGELRKRFAPTNNGGQVTGWDNHRFVRLNVLLKMLAARSPGVLAATSAECHHVTEFCTLIKQMRRQSQPPPGYKNPMTADEEKALELFIKSLEALAKVMIDQGRAISFQPIPNPELRVRPPL